MSIRSFYGVCACVGLYGLAIQGEEASYAPPEESASLESYAYLVDELNHRRRLQFLFQNPQSIFDGLNIGFVQVATGNLTFQRRDLVVLGFGMLSANRVHDSRLSANAGFGPRWRLGLAETLTLREAR